MDLAPGARSGARARAWFVAALGGAFLVLLLLLAYTFARYPDSRLSTGSGPKASVPAWFGPEGAELFYLGLGLMYACLYLWVGSQAPHSARAWRVGAVCGLGSGAIWLVVSILGDWVPALGVILRPANLIGVLGLPVLAGLLVARATGRAGDGALAGFWCGVVGAVLMALAIVAVDNAFATTLVHTAWAHDATCPQPAGDALAACEISDDLGFVAIVLTMFPLLLAGLGALGGVAGVLVPASASARQAAGPAEPGEAGWGGPLMFTGIMLALFIAIMNLKLV